MRTIWSVQSVGHSSFDQSGLNLDSVVGSDLKKGTGAALVKLLGLLG
jgi:hypothetical protein